METKEELLKLLNDEEQKKKNLILTNKQIEALRYFIDYDKVSNDPLLKLHFYKANTRLNRSNKIKELLDKLRN